MSRSNARSRRLRQRPSRTIPATIVAVALLAVGALAATAALARLTGGTWAPQLTGPARSVSALTWGSTAIITASSVLVLLGLVLLVAGLKPGAFRAAQLRPSATAGDAGSAEETDFVISTRALARLAAARADLVDGVDKVSTSASGRRVHVVVTTTSEQADEIRDRVTRDVVDAVSAAGVQPVPRVTTTVRTRGI